jgi:hypothetical protein
MTLKQLQSKKTVTFAPEVTPEPEHAPVCKWEKRDSTHPPCAMVACSPQRPGLAARLPLAALASLLLQ